jgi:threonine synthase
VQLKNLQCVRCGRIYPPLPQSTTCRHCREDIDRPGILDLVYEDYPNSSALKEIILHPDRSKGIWAYEDFLPVEPRAPRITLGEGHIPLMEAPSLASFLGMDSLWLKNETMNPTGSFKDRIAAMVVAKALEAKARTLILVSSGNMATSVAAYGAVAGLETIAIVSPKVCQERLIQIAVYGGRAIRVNGTSSDRLSLCFRAAEEFGWFNANSPHNPYGPHGAKTISYEVFSQSGGENFDWVISPVGFGCNFVGNWKGFEDLLRLGLISRLPRLAAVQAEGSPSLVRAFQLGLEDGVPGPQDTIAGGISQVVTPNSILALKAIRASKGTAVTVTDGEMLRSIPLLAQKGGIYAEPAGVAALAGLKKLVKERKGGKSDRVLVIISGSGLKDPNSSLSLKGSCFPQIEPSLSDFEKTLRSQ